MRSKTFRIGDLFDIHPTKSYGYTNSKLFETKGTVPVVVNSSQNNGIGGVVNLVPTEKGNIITFSDTTTSDSIFYQPSEFIGYSHVQGLYPLGGIEWSKEALLYLVVLFRKATEGKYNYATKFNRKLALDTEVELPITKADKIDFEYMSERIRELEAERIRELEAYLKTTGFEEYELSDEDKSLIKKFREGGVRTSLFKIGDLFDTIKRGKRLKSQDRIKGQLPFITAGIGGRGFSSYIGNQNVEVFPSNCLTIDMFGSVFYRSFEFGADDHVTVLFNESKRYNMDTLLFMSPVIEKSISGKFDYSRNFYASDAYDIEIPLPVNKIGDLDFDFMETFIKIQKKLAIKNVIEWKDKQIELTKKVIAH